MDRNLSIIKSTGRPAQNLHGSCAVLALSNIIGMSYEQATDWSIKNKLAYQVIQDADGTKHVAGTIYNKHEDRTMIYKRIRKGATVIKYLEKDLYEMHQKSTKTPAEMARTWGANQCDRFERRTKISTFMRKNPTGRHLILTKDHALALINGRLYNNNMPDARFDDQLLNTTVTF